MKKYLLAALAVFAFSPAFSQSAGFKLGKWTEIQNAIINECLAAFKIHVRSQFF